MEFLFVFSLVTSSAWAFEHSRNIWVEADSIFPYLWMNTSAQKKLNAVCENDYKGKMDESSIGIGVSPFTEWAQLVYGKCLIETDVP